MSQSPMAPIPAIRPMLRRPFWPISSCRQSRRRPGENHPRPVKPGRPAAPNEPKTWVVDPSPNQGDFPTISAAIEHAAPGQRILVRPGRYREGLRLEKPLEIIGDGHRDDIVVEAAGRDAVYLTRSSAAWPTSPCAGPVTVRSTSWTSPRPLGIGRLRPLQPVPRLPRHPRPRGPAHPPQPHPRRPFRRRAWCTNTARARWRTTTSSATLCPAWKSRTGPTRAAPQPHP